MLRNYLILGLSLCSIFYWSNRKEIAFKMATLTDQSTSIHEASHLFVYWQLCQEKGYEFRPTKLTIIPSMNDSMIEYGYLTFPLKLVTNDTDLVAILLAGEIGTQEYLKQPLNILSPSKMKGIYSSDLIKAAELIRNDLLFKKQIKRCKKLISIETIQKIAVYVYSKKEVTNFDEILTIIKQNRYVSTSF